TVALRQVSLEIAAGGVLAIMGPSGCGKSSLLNILGLLDSPSDGQLFFLNEDIARASEPRRAPPPGGPLVFLFPRFKPNHRTPRGGERRGRADLSRGFRGRAPAPHRCCARAGGAATPRAASSTAAVGWTAAARRGGARTGRRAEADPGRRANRQPRYRKWRGG